MKESFYSDDYIPYDRQEGYSSQPGAGNGLAYFCILMDVQALIVPMSIILLAEMGNPLFILLLPVVCCVEFLLLLLTIFLGFLHIGKMADDTPRKLVIGATIVAVVLLLIYIILPVALFHSIV